jgi:hypothetical protein
MRIQRSVRLGEEDGVAVVFAIQILAILTLMVVATMGSAVSLRDTTMRDVSSKQALAGALSGLDVARYRLNAVRPASNMCLTSTAVAAGTGGAAAGECPAYVGDLGNGDTYGYYVTPELVGGATCGGQAVSAGTTTKRCITAFGTSDGVTRRTQTLVSRGQVPTSLFPFGGVVGLDFVDINENNHGNVASSVASNGPFDLKNCTGTVGGILTWKPGPTATMSENCSGTPVSEAPTPTPWTLQPLDSIYSGTETVNDNASVFGSAAGFSYTPTGRVLKDTNNATLIINGPNPRTGSDGIWTFNFCSLTLTHVTSIKLLNGATARFLTDSGQRVGSGCGASGKFDITNVSGMNYDTVTQVAGDPQALQFFFYGTGNINVNNKSGFSAALYAPDGAVKVTNETRWNGAVAAKSVNATNGFNFTSGDVSGIKAPSDASSTYARAGFVECRSAATAAADPESGC